MDNPITKTTTAFFASLDAAARAGAEKEAENKPWDDERRSAAELLSFAKAVKAVAAADGLSEGEARSMERLLKRVPDYAVDHVRAFDTGPVTAAHIAGTLNDKKGASRLLAGAFAVAAADGISDQEAGIGIEVAEQFGIPADWVRLLAAEARATRRAVQLGDPEMLQHLREVRRYVYRTV